MTHIKRLRESGRHLQLLLDRIEPLAEAGKLGPLLWQLPPTFKRDDQRLAGALAEFPPDLRHAIEFRHPSWFAAGVMDVLRAHGVALVIAHRPEIESFQSHELTADFTYVRFHHGARGRSGNYSQAELREWAGRIAAGPPTRPLRVLQQRLGGVRSAPTPRISARCSRGPPAAEAAGGPRRSR